MITEKMLDALALENMNVTRYGDDVAISGDLKKREK